MFGKRPPVIISIPEPCNQSWQHMLPAGKGRHCQSCQKVVTDFTNFTDAQIVEAIQQSNGAVCGRFVNTQLNRNLQQPVRALPVIKHGWLSKIAATVLMFGAMAQQVMAQQKVSVTTQHQAAPQTKPKPVADTTDIVIRGKVLNYYNSTPVSGISVAITNTSYICTTDVYGRFKFQLPPQFAGQTITIDAAINTLEFLDSTASLLQPVEVTIDSSHFKKSITVYRHPAEILSDVISIAMPSRPDRVREFTGSVIQTQVVIDPVYTVSKADKANRTTRQKIRDFFRIKKHNQ